MKHKALNRSLPAFTIMEMLIVMLLSAIVVGLTYLYFNQFSHYIRNTEQTSNTYSNFNQFGFVFQKDLDEARQIYFQSPDYRQFSLWKP
jgi:type II secretory pathway component PulJ